MGYLLEMFTRASEQKIIRNAMAESGKVLKRAREDLTLFKKNANFEPANYREWFGAPSPERIDYLFTAICTMEYAVNSSTMKVRREAGNAAVASTVPPGAGWDNKSVKEIIEGNRFIMKLNDPFFQPRTADRGGQFGATKTFVHELSHMVAETNEPIGTYPEVYGKILCRQLALDDADHAVRNADTWGYFCIAYLEDAIAPGIEDAFAGGAGMFA